MSQQNQGFHQKVIKKTTRHALQQAPVQTEQQKEYQILSLVDSILPNTMKPVNDKYTGIDYVFRGIKIDRKFGFYYGGKDSIRVRLNRNELINKSDYTMVMHPDRIDFFPTQKIRDYLKKHPQSAERVIEQKPKRDKRTGNILFVSARIKLSDLYAKEGITPLSVIIPLEQLARNRHNLHTRDLAKLQERMERILDKVQTQNQTAKAKIINNSFYKKFVARKKLQNPKKGTNSFSKNKIRARRG